MASRQGLSEGLDLGYPGVPRGLLVLDTVAYRIGEEPGWRGLALPRLEVRHGPLTATLILTPLWALWHLRALFYRYRAGYQGGLPAIVGFVFALPVGAIVLTFLYDRQLALKSLHALEQQWGGSLAERTARRQNAIEAAAAAPRSA